MAGIGVRYESEGRIFNLPLVSIAFGPNPEKNENRGLARGLIAIGDISVGVISFGGLAFGVLSFGGDSLHLACIGCLAFAAGDFGVTHHRHDGLVRSIVSRPAEELPQTMLVKPEVLGKPGLSPELPFPDDTRGIARFFQ